ncbi:MAG: hypothetical protein AB3N11_05040 [Arenibacterium sp.]
MPADDRFMERLARIEHRAKTGQKAEFAPLPEHPDDAKRKKKRSARGILFSWVILPLIAATAVAGVFANELSGVLPAEFVSVANDITARVLSQVETATAGLTTDAENGGTASVAPGDSEVSRILLGQ